MSSPPTQTPTETSQDESFPLTIQCHCSRLKISYPSKPTSLNACHCSVCYKYGVLWGYFPGNEVTITESDGATIQDYIRSDEGRTGHLAFRRCSHCGCVMCWSRLKEGPKTLSTGVNFRLADWRLIEGIPQRTGMKESNEWPKA